MTKTIVNSMTYKGRYDNEINLDKSMTIPDQSLSMREILDRYAMGLPLGGGQEGSFNDEDDEEGYLMDKDDFKKMDLTEQHELMEANVEKIKKLYPKKTPAEPKDKNSSGPDGDSQPTPAKGDGVA